MRAVGKNFVLAKIYTYMVLDRCMRLSTCTFVLSDTSAGHFAPSQQPISVSSSAVNPSTHTVLTSGHYASLIQQLSSDAVKWREIGIYLGFSANESNLIQSKPALLTEAPLAGFRKFYLNGSSGLQGTVEGAPALPLWKISKLLSVVLD